MSQRIVLAAVALVVAVTFPGCRRGDPVSPDSPNVAPDSGDDAVPEFGLFEGEVVGVLNDGSMKLREDFVYVDPSGKRWLAPQASVVDGASIPRAFWTVIGSPFKGRYLQASVVHDVACVEKTESSEDVHRMFYHACRCGGVDESKAKLMFWAVFQFGPSWPDPNERFRGGPDIQARPADPPPPPSEEAILKAMAFIEDNDPDLDEIESLQFD